MTNIFKKALVLVALLAGSAGAFAGSPLDGAFDCQISVPGTGPSTVSMAVVTNAQGLTGTAPMAMSSSNRFWGYGLGTVNGSTFTGFSNFGQPFTFSMNPQTLSFSGTFGVVFNGVPVPSAVSCVKVF